MKILIKCTSFLIGVLFFTACTREVKLDLGKFENKPVLNVLMNQDSVLYVRLSLSERITDGETFKELEQATVRLLENGVFKEKLSVKTIGGVKYYVSSTTVSATMTYQVDADIPDYGKLSGTDLIPDRNIALVQDEKLADAQNEGDRISILSFSIKNTGNRPANFRYRLFNRTPEMIKEQSQLVDFYPNEGIPDIRVQAQREFFSKVALKPGESIYYTFRTRSSYNELNIEVSTLTDESYKYLKSASLAALANEDFTAEKVSVYNNILNGIGFVGGISVNDYPVKMQ